jgi:hypothetical protein
MAGPSAQAEFLYEEPFASLLDSQEDVGSHNSRIVDLRGVEPLTSPVREKQSSIRLPAQTSDFPAQTADSTFINDHELSPVRTSDDDQMMTKLQHVAATHPHLNERG